MVIVKKTSPRDNHSLLVINGPLKITHNVRELLSTQEKVDLRDLLREDRTVSLRKTTGHNDPVTRSRFLKLDRSMNRVQSLLSCITDKATRVDQNDISISRFRCDGVTLFSQ